MKLTVLLLTLASTCLAQPANDNAQHERPARAPQSQIQYKDPDGLRVDWKYYAPQNAQRAQRAETGTGQANFGSQQQSHVVQAPKQQETQYQPYSNIPKHIKQLLAQSYAPQGPYVDPGAFFYQGAPIAATSVPRVTDERQSHPQSQIEREYFNSAVTYTALGGRPVEQQKSRHNGKLPSRQGGIKYKNDDRASEKLAQLPYGSVIQAQSQPKSQYQPYKQISQPQQYNKQASQIQPQYQAFNKQSQAQSQYVPYNKQTSQPQSQYQAVNKQASQPQLRYSQYKAPSGTDAPANLRKNMPMAIQQLLNYQAQLPYNVIANHILYRPKEPFIPKPLPESVKLARQYPTKIYFVKTDGQVYESPDAVRDAGGANKRY